MIADIAPQPQVKLPPVPSCIAMIDFLYTRLDAQQETVNSYQSLEDYLRNHQARSDRLEREVRTLCQSASCYVLSVQKKYYQLRDAILARLPSHDRGLKTNAIR